jgi:membrane associated rhomboid family serine protease
MLVLGVFAVCLVLQILNSADHYELNLRFGLRPRNVQGLFDFVPASFLHVSWNHFEGNALYLLVVGFFAAYQGIGKLLAVTAVVLVTSSLSWWVFGPSGIYAVGASGIICGWIGYGLVGGLYHRKELGRDLVQLLVALYAFAAWQYFWPPWPASTDWRAHVGGVLGGITCGFLLRNFDCPLVSKPWSSQSIKILGI